MRIQLEVKSMVVGAFIGWFGTVALASIAVAKTRIAKEKEEKAE